MFKMVSLAQLPELATHLVEPRIEEPSLVPEITVSNSFDLFLLSGVWCMCTSLLELGTKSHFRRIIRSCLREAILRFWNF